ncbi:MAG TPA: hypothetical protein VIL18_13325 [Longimicrobiales bacterium]
MCRSIRPSWSDPLARRTAPLVLAVLLASGAIASDARAQAPAREAVILSSQVSLSRDEAFLSLELAGGETLTIALRDGRVHVNDEEVGRYRRGDPLDVAWRDLLEDALDASDDRLPELLVEWSAPSGSEAGRRLDRALEEALRQAAAAERRIAASSPAGDTVAALRARIAELERTVAELQRRDGEERRWGIRYEVDDDVWQDLARDAGRRAGPGFGFLRRVGSGISNLLSLLLTYGVLVALGFAIVFFGRRYLEGVADTARHATLRSGIVGLAALFLLIPVFLVGTLVLAISIVGIPALLVWLPVFPAAAVAALVFGYLGVAHASGEALAERRFAGGDWFKRANSYYYVMTGVGLLLALYAASFVVEMAGPWLELVRGLLMFLAVMLTVAAAAIGLGAVLISRAGTRPVAPSPLEEPMSTTPPIEEEGDV